ncbi:MAG: DUF368 domain-containing protein [Treponema sp.]|nr:DUF368 domain-containing protein [Treponema sp.]
MGIIKLASIGFALGITAVIPGISVATMAVVFGVYDRLINVIVPDVKKILAAWMFWLPLAAGGVAGIFFSSKVLTILFNNYSVPTYWFLIGVIAGSIPLVYSKVCRTSSPDYPEQRKFAPPSVLSVICFVIALALMIFMAVIKPEEGNVVYTELSPGVFGLLVLAGALAATAMIIPGISGAFVLLVIGLYRTVLKSVSDMNILLILPVILGAVIGLLLSAAFVRFLLAKAPRETYGAVLGLVTGSIIILYPKGIGEGIFIFVSIVCVLAGFAFSFIMSRDARKAADSI